MKIKQKKVFKSSFDEFISDPKNKISFEREYRKLDRSETLIEAMLDAKISVRALAKKAGVSPTIIQELRTGERENVTVNTLDRVLDALGYQIRICPKQQQESTPETPRCTERDGHVTVEYKTPTGKERSVSYVCFGLSSQKTTPEKGRRVVRCARRGAQDKRRTKQS